ncbi:hypothetical protein L2E82_40523 [Cichorium intybus]|uniref:Uncharacterized protein n=1 Tax=Cichorium intybus TaxID=13427 RepID=A0ACB9AKP7_CICIN|nr:hypothetical protein L2E82_40523 [Cichorium intybus]
MKSSLCFLFRFLGKAPTGPSLMGTDLPKGEKRLKEEEGLQRRRLRAAPKKERRGRGLLKECDIPLLRM